MFTKSTLKLAIPAALLFAGASANAQNTVTIGDGSEKTWADVVTYLNNQPTPDQLQAAVTKAQNAVNAFTDAQKTIKATDPVLQSAIDASKAFMTAYKAYYDDAEAEDPSTPTVWTKITTNRDGEATLLISYTEVTATGWSKTTVGQFYTNVTSKSAKEIALVKLYLNAENPSIDVTKYNDPATQQKNVLTVIDTFLKELADETAWQTEQPNPDYEAALKTLADAEAAQNQSSTAYQTITLNGDVNVEKAITNFSGEIFGNGHVFNVNGNGAVFTKFDGQMTNAAVNGKLASSVDPKAKLSNVAVWTGAAGTLYTLVDDATKAQGFKTVGELAFNDRDNIGVAAGKLANLTDETRVYSISVYTSATPTTYFVTSAAENEYTNTANDQPFEPAPNAFIKTATDDLEGVNVYYKGTEANAKATAKEVVITDQQNFFCPEEITAETVTYKRTFEVGHATACLPFAVSDVNFEGNAMISTFKQIDETKKTIEFDFQSGSVPAYKPILIKVLKETELTGLNNVTLTATTEQLVQDEKTTAYGVLKETGYLEIQQAAGTDRVYGLQGSSFKYATAGAKFPAFRMVIGGPTVDNDAQNAPARIVILGEDGQEVDMSGVDNVATDAAELEVVGGVGELTISTSADLGTVAVYSIDGRVAANVDAVAGTTTVNLAKGVYIIMGKKVLVK